VRKTVCTLPEWKGKGKKAFGTAAGKGDTPEKEEKVREQKPTQSIEMLLPQTKGKERFESKTTTRQAGRQAGRHQNKKGR